MSPKKKTDEPLLSPVSGPAQAHRPLADKIRPTTKDEFVGQAHLRDRIATFLAAERLPSLLFFGPPGCGKSTLALLLAEKSGLPFIRVSAPEAGLSQLRKQLAGARLLVLDELHRFSKAQQDFFLPLLESGEITLLATTTENPSFSVTRQLLSRLHVLRLGPLTDEDLLLIVRRGAEALDMELSEEAMRLLVTVAHGDARTLLNLVEHAASLAPEKREVEHLKAALPEFVQRHDKAGDSHYDIASALIKSIRGSDPDAALYYLACLLEGGEDPRFVCRRLILSASEDVGLANPQALPMTVACQQAVEFVGMPEGFIPLAETTVYLAVSPKSNASYAAYRRAQRHLREHGTSPVPIHLRNPATRLMKEWGYGEGYKYPHDFPHGWAEQRYLPDEVNVRFYKPSENGQEPRLLAWWRDVTGRR